MSNLKGASLNLTPFNTIRENNPHSVVFLLQMFPRQ